MKTTTDVVIIGGGVLGAATAFELASRGLDTVLLERHLPGRQGSGTTAGNLHIQAIHPARPGQEFPVDTRRLLPLQKITSQLWGELEERLGTSVEVTRCGGFTVAETEADVQALREKAVWEGTAGIPTELLDGDEVRAAVPALGTSVLAATYSSRDGHANSLLTTPAYIAAATSRGARIYVSAPVTDVSRKGGKGWRVTSTAGEFSAGAVVNAAGPWIQQVSAMAGVHMPMAPVAIQMHETVRAPRFLHHLVQHVSRGLSVKQVRSGNVIIGGGWPAGPLDLGGTTLIEEPSLLGNMGDARRVIPRLADLRLSRAWPGPLAATPDEMPVIGPFPGAEGLFVVGGTYAFTFSPLWARTIADLIEGCTPLADITDLYPNRLIRPDKEVNQ